MYFVDRERIDQILFFMDRQLLLLENSKAWDDEIGRAALERVCHTIVESILDVGNMMIDGFIMRDPGSYNDIIDILEDEQVITAMMSIALKKIVQFRKILVQEYTNIEHDKLLSSFIQEVQVLKEFSFKVREYLVNELGPVTAFKK